MSSRISQILDVIAYVAERYSPGMSSAKTTELRIEADKEVALQLFPPVARSTVSDKYRRRLRPDIRSTADFDLVLYDWLHAGGARLRSILLNSAKSSDDERVVRNFFAKRRLSALADADALQGIMDDVKELEKRGDLESTTRLALIDARKGQGAFRSSVLSVWGNKCAVTGCTLLELLRASHIKPWCEANDDERLDSENGLILVANLDALFDAGLISFDDCGNMLVSERIDPQTCVQLQIPQKLSRQPYAKQRKYLEYHRAKKFTS